MEFEWDGEKAAANLSKHGVSFDEAKTVLISTTQIILTMSIAILSLASRGKVVY